MNAEVDKFYEENYDKLIKYVMNSKTGGDGSKVDEDSAHDIVHNAYIYHASHPDKFVSSYIWNKLIQSRKDYMDAINRYDTNRDGYHSKSIRETESDTEGEQDWTEQLELVKKEIRKVHNPESRQAITSHLIYGEPIARDNYKARSAVRRFIYKMITKYGGG